MPGQFGCQPLLGRVSWKLLYSDGPFWPQSLHPTLGPSSLGKSESTGRCAQWLPWGQRACGDSGPAPKEPGVWTSGQMFRCEEGLEQPEQLAHETSASVSSRGEQQSGSRAARQSCGARPMRILTGTLEMRGGFLVCGYNWNGLCTEESVNMPGVYLALISSGQFSRSVMTPWTAAHQASLSIANSWSLFKLMSIESMMPSSHLILCHPLLLLSSIFPSIRVLSNESALRIFGSE